MFWVCGCSVGHRTQILERSLESRTGFTCWSPATMSDPPQRSHHDQLPQRPYRFGPDAPRVISIDHDVSGNLRS